MEEDVWAPRLERWEHLAGNQQEALKEKKKNQNELQKNLISAQH